METKRKAVTQKGQREDLKGTQTQGKGQGRLRESKMEGKRVQEEDAKERGLNGTGRTTEKKGGNTKKGEPSTKNGSGDGKTAPGHTVTTGKGRRKEASLANTRDEAVKQPDRAGDGLGLDVNDYLHLLELLHINLPGGVLSPEVIKLSKADSCIKPARDIITKLEAFKIKFSITPRLACTKMRRMLNLKDQGNVLKITEAIFFSSRQVVKREKKLKEIWRNNSTSTVRGFRMRDMYKYKPISTPKMDSTATKRTLNTEPKVTKGKSVEKNYLEDSEEPRLNEMECLKFYHELKMKNSGKKVQYTRGNTVEYSFLSGRLDFLAHLQQERLVIECKGTTGDMVGKVFTKTQSDDHLADLVETHGYFFQTQAYMYILNQDNKLLSRPLSNRAVMVIRHYHKDDNSPQDFYWNELQLDEKIKKEIDKLMKHCRRKVLACFLAVLDLIFQKEITVNVE